MSELKSCPWCGAGTTEIVENGKVWAGMKYSDPVSVSVRHWCEPVEGQPSRMIERIGRDRESAIAAWNRRAGEPRRPMTEDDRARILMHATSVEDVIDRTERHHGITDAGKEPTPLQKLADLSREMGEEL